MTLIAGQIIIYSGTFQITCMEHKITEHQKENASLEQHSLKMNDYLMAMRSSLIQRLRDIKVSALYSTQNISIRLECLGIYIYQISSLL